MIPSSFPACWESNLGMKIGHVFRLSVLNTKNGICLPRVLEKNINLACKDKLLSHETEIVKKNSEEVASSQNYDLTCHLPTKNCFLDHEKQLLGFRFGGSPLHSHSDHVTIQGRGTNDFLFK